MLYVGTAHHHMIALNFSLRADELLVLARNNEAFEIAIPGHQPATDVVECQRHGVTGDFHRLIDRARVHDPLAVCHSPGSQTKPPADGFFAGGMDIAAVTGIGDD